MPGDYSKKLFDRRKHYSAVLEQQGRVQVEADWNEQVDIQQYRIATETNDVIGLTGVPKQNGGFNIQPFADGSDFSILPGRIYIDGLLFELEPETATYLHQPHYPSPDVSNFSGPASPVGTPASPVVPFLTDGTYILYLVGWQREINFHDDPHIKEVALGEADTTTRLKNVWQVRMLKVSNLPSPGCTTSFPEWDALINLPLGKLMADADTNTTEIKPCSLPPGSGYTGMENQLYRIQVLKGGDRSVATFIWSRDNGSVETNIIQASADTVTVADIGKDHVLGFANGQWVEIVEKENDTTLTSLLQIDTIEQDTLKIHLNGSLSQYVGKTGLKLRRWDMTGAALGNGIAMTNDWINIESGIKVQFLPGNYRPGDYWLMPARTATGKIEWPLDNLSLPMPQLPVGIVRHYAKLGLVVAKNGKSNFIDCRRKFPTLTGICAEDVCFNNTNCNFPSASTVQEALDILCQRTGGGSCTIVVKPGPGWETALNILTIGMDAQICFQAGLYPLASPVLLKNKGHLKLSGCGAASRIVLANGEAAIVFDQCKSVTVRDLYAEAATAGTNSPRLATHLNGALSFLGCEAVNIGHVSVKSGYGTSRDCTCITVINEIAAPCMVRIEDCDLQVADRQQGILIANTSNCWIERNTIKVYFTSTTSATRNNQLELGIRHLLLSNLQTGPIGPGPGASNNVTITSGKFVANFKSDSSLQNEWKKAFAALSPTPVASQKELQVRLQKLAEKLVTNKTLQGQFKQFGVFISALAAQTRAIASQGITIGGRVAKNIFITNNIISDVLQGIHIGVSHRTTIVQADMISNLSVCGNTIAVTLLRTVGKQDRYGIFVGNCSNLLIENNTLTLERIDANDNTMIEGIRVFGILGFRAMISRNLVTSLDNDQKKSFSFGINLNPLRPKPGTAQWVVSFNVSPGKIGSTTVRTGVIYQSNT